MTPGKSYTHKQRVDIFNEFLELYATGQHTVESACHSVGVKTPVTIQKWRLRYKGFQEKFEEAREQLNRSQKITLRINTLQSLRRRVEGYMIQETKVRYGFRAVKDENDEFKLDEDGERIYKKFPISEETHDKHVAPSDTAIIFAMTNIDRDEWKRNNVEEKEASEEVTGELTTVSQIDKEINSLRELLDEGVKSVTKEGTDGQKTGKKKA